MSIPSVARKQTAVIHGWRPTTSANRSHEHWAKVRHAHHVDRNTAWATAKQAGWVFVPGRVRLTITLVYSRRYPSDKDNRYARVKGVVDGLKGAFFADDVDTWLDLQVPEPLIEPGTKETRLEIESL